MRFVPGDPVLNWLGTKATKGRTTTACAAQYGLDSATDAAVPDLVHPSLFQGDLGYSVLTSCPVSEADAPTAGHPRA